MQSFTKYQVMNSTSPSNRSFGFLFAGIFFGLSAYSRYRGAGATEVFGWLGVSVLTALLALVAPGVLAPFNKAWMGLGNLIGNAVSPLVLGVIYFVLITPIALITRLFGRDELRLRRKNTTTYWIDRSPPGPAGDSFKNQF